eukprot:13822143-Alexandrium_andersonii.AAC.1
MMCRRCCSAAYLWRWRVFAWPRTAPTAFRNSVPRLLSCQPTQGLLPIVKPVGCRSKVGKS